MPQATSHARRIRSRYAAHSGAAGTDPERARRLAVQLGYRPEALENLPAGANLGLSCGNPLAVAGLGPGDDVLDLGCGAGFDVFVASRQVGERGRVVGLDSTPEMIDRANRNAEAHRRATGLDNVEFRVGSIESMPFDDGVFDLVISNCVLNLVSDQRRGRREILRVLRPGGRLAVTDLALTRPWPGWLLKALSPWIGCAAGLSTADGLGRGLQDAGFVEVVVEPQAGHVAAMAGCETSWRGRLVRLPGLRRLTRLLLSVSVTGKKPLDD